MYSLTLCSIWTSLMLKIIGLLSLYQQRIYVVETKVLLTISNLFIFSASTTYLRSWKLKPSEWQIAGLLSLFQQRIYVVTSGAINQLFVKTICVDSKNRLEKSIRAKTHFLYVYTLTPTRLRRVGVSVISSQHLLYHLAVHVGHMYDNGWTILKHSLY